MGLRARELVEREYSLTATAARYRQVYERALLAAHRQDLRAA
jgi:hypothetical protein